MNVLAVKAQENPACNPGRVEKSGTELQATPEIVSRTEAGL